MILVDMNQVMIANLMVSLNQSEELQEGLVRHMVLNSLRGYRKEFYKTYGELVLCYDSKHYWRREVFPYYKGTRKKDRAKSKHNWDNIFDLLNKIKAEFKEHLPYKVLEIDGAEADDIIAVLCKHQGLANIRLQNNMQPAVKTLILSGDKDFIQLKRYGYVTQYNPCLKKYIEGLDPKLYIAEHVMKGDRSDGIPNFLSDDSCLVEGRRQKPLAKVKIARWSTMSPEEFCFSDETMENYRRNQRLIDFDYIPEEISAKIIDTYESANPPSRKHIFTYMVEHQLNDLVHYVSEF
jgi:5'-3' exonuclease